MSALEFQPTRKLLFATGVTFVACLLAAAWLGSEGRDAFGLVLLHDLLQVAGAAALAIGGVGAFVKYLSYRRWEAVTQVIAVDQLHAALRHTGAVMSRTTQAILGEAEVGATIDRAFQLPWTPMREATARDLVEGAGRQVTAILLGRADHEILSRTIESADQLKAHSDGLCQAVTALDPLLEGEHVLALLAEASFLRRRVRILVDQASRSDLDEDAAANQTAVAAEAVLRTGIAIAQKAREPFEQIQERVKDPGLREEFERAEGMRPFEEATQRWEEAAAATEALVDQNEEVIEKLRQRSERARRAAGDAG